MPFTVASITTSGNLDGNTKTTSSDTDSTFVDDTSTDTSSGTTAVEDTTIDSTSSTDGDTSDDSSDNLLVKEGTSTDSDDGSLLEDNNSYDKTINSSIEDNSTSEDNSTTSSLNSTDDDLYYAPNERNVSEDEIVTKSENIVGYLSSGIETEVKIKSSNDIDSVKLTPSTDLENVNVTVIKLKDKPEEIIDPPKKNATIYKYLDIKLSSNDIFIDEEEISSLEFSFKVGKNWISDNEIDKNTVKLIRYHDGVWQNLSTNLTSENETCISYTAASPGFSTFAVVGSKVIEKNESYGSDDVNIPWSIIIAFIMALSIMLVFILFKARYIYLKDENK